MNYNLGDIFTSQQYELSNFSYKDVQLDLYSLKSASTDFDLTGQIIWPSAIELTKFIIDEQQQFQNKNVIELGAGAGLCGFVAAKYCNKIYITDGNETVQDLIQKNVDYMKLQNVISQQFQWGTEEAKKYDKIDILIGADIIFWPQSVIPLFETLTYFFEQNPELKVYVGGIKRYQQTEDQIDELLKKINRKRIIIKQLEQYQQIVYIYQII